MKAINDYGLVGYVQRGGELPSSDFIDAYHQHIKTFYARNKSTLNLIEWVISRGACNNCS